MANLFVPLAEGSRSIWNTSTVYLFGIVVAIGIGDWVLTSRARTVEAKIKITRLMATVTVAVLFGFFVVSELRSPPINLISVLVACAGGVAVAWVNWISLIGCQACRKVSIKNPPWSRPSTCPKCGARLDEKS